MGRRAVGCLVESAEVGRGGIMQGYRKDSSRNAFVGGWNTSAKAFFVCLPLFRSLCGLGENLPQ